MEPGAEVDVRAKGWRPLLAGAVSLLVAANAASSEDAFLNAGDKFCPQDTRLVSSALARENKAALCNMLKDWDVARLAGNASLSGPGRNCEIYEADFRDLALSLCEPLRDYSRIRGVLLQGDFRTPRQLTLMSGKDWRKALATELANRTAGALAEYEALGNEDLAGAGSLLVYLRRNGGLSDAALSTMSLADMRQAVLIELNAQTGLPLAHLGGLSDLTLADLLMKG